MFDFSIADNGDGRIKLPHDFKERGGEPGDWVVRRRPCSGFGKGVRASKQRRQSPASPRQEFAGWLTSRDNPRFTKVIANRMWKRVMGTGLFEPLDNFSAASAPSNPALMGYLEEVIVKISNFDLNAFQKSPLQHLFVPAGPERRPSTRRARLTTSTAARSKRMTRPNRFGTPCSP